MVEMAIIEFLHRNPIIGELAYIQDEYSFNFTPSEHNEMKSIVGSKGNTSLLIDTFQIEISVEFKTTLFTWGFWPNTNWVRRELNPPESTDGTLIFKDYIDLEMGVSKNISTRNWITQHDCDTGWIRISEDKTVPDENLVRIATNTLLGTQGQKLSSVMLRPEFK